jgi:hypothetical protein
LYFKLRLYLVSGFATIQIGNGQRGLPQTLQFGDLDSAQLGVDTVGSYALGLNKATIEFTLSAIEPTDVVYLTENDAKRLGLAVAIVPVPVTTSSRLTSKVGSRFGVSR